MKPPDQNINIMTRRLTNNKIACEFEDTKDIHASSSAQ